MALILAIEPDRRQASHLTAMVRGRLHAEFVIGDSAERALAALGDRVPDLVLTTALLSPKDETELTDRLRALDGAAAHVQTLTIPVLASPNAKKASKSGGMLSALLGDKGDDGPVEGCDPAFFAEQCKEYLDRAASDKAASQEHRHDNDAAVIAAPAAIEPEPLEAVEPIAAVAAEEVQAVQILQTEQAEAIAEFAEPAPIEPPANTRRSFYTIADDDEAPSSLMAAVAALAEEEPEEAIVESFAPASADSFAPVETESFAPAATESFAPATTESLAPATSQSDEALDDSFADFDLSSMLEDPARVKPEAETFESEQHVVYELDANAITATHEEPAETVSEVQFDTPLPRQEVRTWPILDDLATAAAGEPVVVETGASAVPERREPDESELAEWSDIIEALRRDAHPVALDREQSTAPRLNTFDLPNLLADEPVWPDAVPTEAAAVESTLPASEAVAQPVELVAAEPAVAEQATGEPPVEQANGRRKRGRKVSVEDEWGFFDPDRAGFAALLAKLEEITEDDSAKTHRT